MNTNENPRPGDAGAGASNKNNHRNYTTRDIDPALAQTITDYLMGHGGRKVGAEVRFTCPAHPQSDEHPSGNWNPTKAVWTCRSCGAGGGAIDLAKLLAVELPRRNEAAIYNPDSGVTVLQLAEAKHLDPDFLCSLGVVDAKYHRQPAVRIEYRGVTATVTGTRYRVALKGDRFRWRQGDKVQLYGLWRLEELRKAGWVLLVEGESDCWAGWAHGLPVLGVPGKATWQSEWARHLVGLQVYVWQEPGADDFPRLIAADIPDLSIIPAPDGIKDLADAHVQGLGLAAWLDGLKGTALIPMSAVLQTEQDAAVAAARKAAAPVLAAADPLDLVDAAILADGFGGERLAPLINYLAATSRLLGLQPGSMPVHLANVGAPSSGKSYGLRAALNFLPPAAFHVIDAGSPRVLIYDDVDLRHRVVVFSEADSMPSGEDNPAASAIRNLLQDGHLHYKVTMRDSETGKFVVQTIDRQGPSVLITTTVKRLGAQLDSRLFSIDVNDSPGQVKMALVAQASRELAGPPPAQDALVAFQSYLQALTPWNVLVPFADTLAQLIGESTPIPRINRDFSRLLALVKAVAILRHQHRQRDEKGRLVATVDDYGYVFGLIGPMYETTITGASAKVRELVRAVEGLTPGDLPALEMANRNKVTVTALAKLLDTNKMDITRRCQSAMRLGWLVNHEIRKGFPANLGLGEPMPDRVGLPHPDAIGHRNTVTPVSGLYKGTPPTVLTTGVGLPSVEISRLPDGTEGGTL